MKTGERQEIQKAPSSLTRLQMVQRGWPNVRVGRVKEIKTG